ncbi:MAG: adenylosuccinate synthase [Acidobacteria bacterium]|nr:adenylosuccinate synthase [Acidobacteriota bacterium]
MSNLIVVGAQWGDEGKGKIVDFLAARFDIVARYNGGNNAGHTIEIGPQQFVLQLVPSGILRPDKKAVIGNGVVVDPAALLKEIEGLEQRGISVSGRLFLSNRAHLIFPYHRFLETELENSPWRVKIGTTARGIGPAYEDKIGRRGIRAGDIVDEAQFRCLVETAVQEKQTALQAWGSKLTLSAAEHAEQYLQLCSRLRPMIADTVCLLRREMDAGRSVLFEGAQGTMLDVDHGTYPYVTSSSATAGGACTGLGVSPTRISGVVGVSKAYTTRVGSGPFPTEDKGAAGDRIRERGREFGSVTGRSRRCGWLDLPVLRYSAALNGLDSLIITKLDVLDELDEISVCTAYDYDGALCAEMPAPAGAWERLRPVYQTLPGWKQPTCGITRYEALPQAARDYLEFIGSQLGLEIPIISTGPEREQSIVRSGTRLEKLLANSGSPRN